MFFLINIVLTLRYVPWGFEYADNRYFYLPSIGLLFCLASGIDRLRIAMSSQPLARNALMYGIAASFIVCFTIISFSRTGIWKNSISLWDDVLKKSSQSKVTGVAYLYRGLAKMDEQDYLEAIKDFSEVMRLQPLNPYAYFDRAAARSYLGDYAGAIEDSNRALELDPKAVQAYINRAAAKAFLKDYRGAMADYERVLEIDPNNYEIYRGRCLLRSEARDISGAIADCEKATQLNSYGDKARAILCSLRFESGDISGAVSDCAKLVLLRPTDAKAIANLGNAQAMSGMCSDAIGTLSAAIGLGNSDKNIFYNRALCRIRLGDRQGACSDWKESAIQGDRESAGLVGKYCK
jgi:tetratricopeptide (TPR) repeat protein